MKYFKLTGCLFIGLMISISCDSNKATIRSSPVSTNVDSFNSDVSKFEFSRYKVYKNHMDLFLVENSFYKTLMKKYKKIYLFPMQILHNSFDTLRERRQMILVDTNAIFYYAIVPDNGFTRKLPVSNKIVYVDSEIMGFKITDDMENPGLEMPEFYISIDSIHKE